MPTLILLEPRLDPRTGYTRSIGSEIELDAKRAELMVSYGQAEYKGDAKKTKAVVASARAQEFAQTQRQATKPKPTNKSTTGEIVNLDLDQKVIALLVADDESGNDVPAFGSIYELNDWMDSNDLASKSKIGKKTKALIEISVRNWVKANPKPQPKSKPVADVFSDDEDDEDEDDASLDTLLGDDDDLSDL